MNHAPTGPMGILGPDRPEPGALLTGRPNAIVDLDGMDWRDDSVRWQWLRDGVEIEGATAQVYRVTEADEGADITVRFSYEDFGGTRETVTSAPRQVPDEDREAVAVFYSWGLLREPDDAGLDFWADRLDDILQNEQLDRVLAMRQLMLEFTQGDGYNEEAVVIGT